MKYPVRSDFAAFLLGLVILPSSLLAQASAGRNEADFPRPKIEILDAASPRTQKLLQDKRRADLIARQARRNMPTESSDGSGAPPPPPPPPPPPFLALAASDVQVVKANIQSRQRELALALGANPQNRARTQKAREELDAYWRALEELSEHPALPGSREYERAMAFLRRP